jgi:hypothetical protein
MKVSAYATGNNVELQWPVKIHEVSVSREDRMSFRKEIRL